LFPKLHYSLYTTNVLLCSHGCSAILPISTRHTTHCHGRTVSAWSDAPQDRFGYTRGHTRQWLKILLPEEGGIFPGSDTFHCPELVQVTKQRIPHFVRMSSRGSSGDVGVAELHIVERGEWNRLCRGMSEAEGVRIVSRETRSRVKKLQSSYLPP